MEAECTLVCELAKYGTSLLSWLDDVLDEVSGFFDEVNVFLVDDFRWVLVHRGKLTEALIAMSIKSKPEIMPQAFIERIITHLVVSGNLEVVIEPLEASISKTPCFWLFPFDWRRRNFWDHLRLPRMHWSDHLHLATLCKLVLSFGLVKMYLIALNLLLKLLLL